MDTIAEQVEALWALAPDVPAEIRREIEELAAPPPQWLPDTAGAAARWAAASRVAAAVAFHLGAEDSHRDRVVWSWYGARSLYESRLPTK
jgi:hypothetical protein